MNEREAYIALNMMDKVGPVGVRAMVAHLGSAAAVFDVADGGLAGAVGVSSDLCRAVMTQRGRVGWQEEIEKTDLLDAWIVTPVDENYPKPLMEIHDPPLALYVRGTLKEGDRNSIAVVGTRRPTHYGRDTAERMGYQLVQAGFTVVSGLALGIDTAAHKGAIQAGGRTLAVIGSALDCLYPPRNRELADRISGQGAVISEFPLGRHPDKTTFPMRNRIVSGLTMGTLVVEAGIRSGALITTRQALEQGRSVFAVPGRIDSPMSSGTHDLIRNGASLVTDIDDVLAEYEFLIPEVARATRKAKRRVAPELDADEGRLASALEEGERDVDQLIRVSGLSAGAVSSLLLGLEMKKIIRMLPGRRVELVRS